MSETIKKSTVSKADEFAAVEIRASEVKQQMESAEAVARQLQAGIDARKNKLDALEARVEEALAQQQAVGATTTPETAVAEVKTVEPPASAPDIAPPPVVVTEPAGGEAVAEFTSPVNAAETRHDQATATANPDATADPEILEANRNKDALVADFQNLDEQYKRLVNQKPAVSDIMVKRRSGVEEALSVVMTTLSNDVRTFAGSDKSLYYRLDHEIAIARQAMERFETPEASPAADGEASAPSPADVASPELTSGQKTKIKNALEQEAARKRIRYVAEVAALKSNPDLLNADKIREKFAGDLMLFHVIARDILGQDYTNFSAAVDKQAREKSVAGLREALQKAGYTEDILKAEQYEQVYDALIADRDNQVTKEKAEQEKKRGFWNKVGRGAGKVALYAGSGLAGGALAGPMGGIMVAGSVRFVDGLFKIRAERKAVAAFSKQALGDPDGKVCKGFAEKLAVMVSALAENNLRAAEGTKPSTAAELAKHFFDKTRRNFDLDSVAGDYGSWSNEEKDSLAQKLALYYVSEEKTDGVLSEERKQKLGGLWSRIHGRDGFARGYEFPWKSTLKGYLTGGDREMDRSFADKRADGVFGLVTGTLLATGLRSVGLGRVFAAYGGARVGMRIAQGREGMQNILEPRKAARVALEAAKAGFASMQDDLANTDRHHVLHKLEAEVGSNIILARQAMTRLEAEGSANSIEYVTLRNELNKIQREYVLAQTEAVFVAKTNTERVEKMEQMLHNEESLETLINKQGEQKTAAARWKVRRGAVYGALLGLALAEGAHQAFEYYQNGNTVHLTRVQQGLAAPVVASVDTGSVPDTVTDSETTTVNLHDKLYVVGHHEGITHPIMRQLEDQGMSHNDAMLKARDIALEQGWMKADGSETWVKPEGEIAVELHADNSVTLHDLKPETSDDLYEVRSNVAAHARAVESGEQEIFDNVLEKKLGLPADAYVYATDNDAGIFHFEKHTFGVRGGVIDMIDGEPISEPINLDALNAREQFQRLLHPVSGTEDLLTRNADVADASSDGLAKGSETGSLLPPPGSPDQIVPEHVSVDNVLRPFDENYAVGMTGINVPISELNKIGTTPLAEFIEENKGTDWGFMSGWKKHLANYLARLDSGLLATNKDKGLELFIQKNPRAFGGK